MKAISCAIIVVCLLANIAASYGQAPGYPYVPPYVWQGKAATAEESVARGLSDVISSAGMANLYHSEAAINYTQARSNQLDNAVKQTSTYYQRKQMYKDYHQRPKPTPERLFRLAQQGIPEKLSPSELDPITGKINWPIVLQDEPFNEMRAKMDELFKERAANQGQLPTKSFMELQSVGRSLQNELKKHVKDYPPMNYMNAKGFVDSLLYDVTASAG